MSLISRSNGLPCVPSSSGAIRCVFPRHDPPRVIDAQLYGTRIFTWLRGTNGTWNQRPFQEG